MEEKPMVMLKHLYEFDGVNGSDTTDETFNSLADSLEVYGKVIGESEDSYHWVTLVNTLYQDVVSGEKYILTYQVRNAETPEGVSYAYAFNRIPE